MGYIVIMMNINRHLENVTIFYPVRFGLYISRYAIDYYCLTRLACYFFLNMAWVDDNVSSVFFPFSFFFFKFHVLADSNVD